MRWGTMRRATGPGHRRAAGPDARRRRAVAWQRPPKDRRRRPERQPDAGRDTRPWAAGMRAETRWWAAVRKALRVSEARRRHAMARVTARKTMRWPAAVWRPPGYAPIWTRAVTIERVALRHGTPRANLVSIVGWVAKWRSARCHTARRHTVRPGRWPGNGGRCRMRVGVGGAASTVAPSGVASPPPPVVPVPSSAASASRGRLCLLALVPPALLVLVLLILAPLLVVLSRLGPACRSRPARRSRLRRRPRLAAPLPPLPRSAPAPRGACGHYRRRRRGPWGGCWSNCNRGHRHRNWCRHSRRNGGSGGGCSTGLRRRGSGGRRRGTRGGRVVVVLRSRGGGQRR
mmetsp:Transcript_75902/g.213794  ORF Transcript_75902/g.213794 Transcript_75902/m.213794 type:complete len:345 (-) Transcript_75902:1625-2659(-)